MARYGMKLREAVKDHGVRKAGEILREGLSKGTIAADKIQIRELAESMIGADWARHLKNCASRAAEMGTMELRESMEAVDSSGFSAITGQLLIDTIREKYKLATFVTDQMFTMSKISNGNLGPQREPYLSDVTDDPAMIQPQQPYPQTAFVGQYVDYPAPEKFGRICSVTFEAVYSDLTRQIMDSAASVGRRVGLWVEKQRLRVALGITNNHSWNGTSYNTYQASTPWINSLTDFTLTNWTSLNRIEQLFAQMLDPVLGEPIEIDGYQLLVMPQNRMNAKRIISATETRAGDITTGTGNQDIAGNPLENYTLMTSKHARKRLTDATGGADPGAGYTAPVADSLVLVGDLKRAFLWREVFGLQTIQAPPQNPAEFNQDIVTQVKANVYGVACVRDPRYVVRAYNSSAT